MLDGLLDAMRDAVLRTLPTDIDIRRSTPTKTATGGTTRAWATASTTKGRIDGITAMDLEVAERLAIKVEHSVILPHDADVTPEDRLRWDGLEYAVSTQYKNPTEPILQRVLVVKVADS